MSSFENVSEASLTEVQPTDRILVDSLRTVAFHTLGCKANQLETSTLAGGFRDQGWRIVPFDDPAEVYVINTCTVTERSDQESRRMVRRARLSNPEARIVVTGCYAQVSPEELAALDGVSFVIGNNYKDGIVDLVQSTPPSERPLVKVSDIDKSRIMEGASSAALDGTQERTRGSLKIQDGCDYKCTYCIIWEARGLSRSLPVDDLKLQLSRMIDAGFKEIVLTGINIGQYEHESSDLADLLSGLIQLPGQFRLRLSSLDPMEVSEKLIDVVAQSGGKICPYFHLSAQSAEDYVLKRMGRRHHVADMLRVCNHIAEQIPYACVGSDIIVGFPGETLERFEATYETLKNAYMNYFHVFSYSKRKGTPAASFPEQVPEREKKARAARLRSLSEEKNLAYRQRFLGKTLEVIVEQDCRSGMSENYIKIQLDANGLDLQPNDLAQVTLTLVDVEQSFGRVSGIAANRT
ncbi:MAG TPA: tRNA (N(6)-L-threonylcarbamoyladenosine(37)-C(2))-methylthiotransferase MtaB [Coleofasciculaceae cyanobacterium]|jgi:threonylcarbamoyladenosine tRNA methylthiotransferase MtaB